MNLQGTSIFFFIFTIYFRRTLSVEYLGCKEDSVMGPALSISPSAYDQTVLPRSCIEACTDAGKKYAGVLSSAICLCGDDVTDMTDKTDDDCNSQCVDDTQKECGGDQYFSVFLLDPPFCIIDLTLTADEGPLISKEEMGFSQSSENCRPTEFAMDYGDGAGKSIFFAEDDFPSKHTYYIAQEYTTMLTARTTDKIFTEETSADVAVNKALPESIQIDCPELLEPEEEFTCNITFESGIDNKLTINFDDGSDPQVLELPDDADITVGHAVPQVKTQDMVSNDTATQNVIYLDQGDFPKTGYVTAAELYATVDSTKVDMKILKPVCSDGNFYCGDEKACIKDSDECPLPCDGNFDPVSGSCPKAPTENPTFDERKSHSISADTEGHKYEAITKGDVEVEEGDFLGFEVQEGGVAFRFVEPDSTSDETADDLTSDKNPSNKWHYFQVIMSVEITYPFPYSYKDNKDYEVEVTLENKVTNKNLKNSTKIVVQAPLRVLGFDVDPLFVPGEKAFTVTVTLEEGSNFDVDIYKDQHKVLSKSNTDLSEQPFIFTCGFECHGGEAVINMSVVVGNKHNTLENWTTVIVQHRVTDGWTLTTDAPKLAPDSIEVKATLRMDHMFPTNATIYFDWGDGTITEEPVKIIFGKQDIKSQHEYEKSGDYLINVTISNLVSSQTLNATVKLYEPIVGISATHAYEDPKSQSIKPGLGPERRIYPPGSAVIFNPKHSEGSVDEYIVEFADSNDPVGKHKYKPGETVSHEFTEVGEYCINIYGSNAVIERSDPGEVCITIDNLEMGFRLIEGSLVDKNETKWFEVEFDSVTPDSCVQIDFDDKSTKECFGDENSCKQYFPKAKCMGPFENPFNMTHVYEERGVYNITAEACNAKECQIYRDNITITDLPCPEPPKTELRGAFLDEQQPDEWMRSKAIRFYALTSYKCDVPVEVTRLWRVWLLNETSFLPIEEILLEGPIPSFNKSFLHLFPNFLPYGLYKVGIEVETSFKEYDMYYTEPQPVINVKHTFLRIVPSPLFPAIMDGGVTKIQRGYGQTIVLNPVEYSLDPDFPKDRENFTYKWFCYQMDNGESLGDLPEEYDESNLVNVLEPTGNHQGDGGCFGTGPGKVNITGGKWELNTKSFYKDKTTYNITLILHKFDRMAFTWLLVEIIDGMPPMVSVKCRKKGLCQIVNRGIIVNPTKRLALYGSTEENCTQIPKYQWEGFKLTPDTWEEEPINNLADYSIGIDNYEIAIKKEFFDEYSDVVAFSFYLSVTCEDVVGKAGLFVFINGAPTSGKCVLEEAIPGKNKALFDYFFVRCDGWKDPENKRIEIYAAFLHATSLGSDNFEQSMLVTQDIFPVATIVFPCGTFNVKMEIVDDLGATTKIEVENGKNFKPQTPTKSEFDDFIRSNWIEQLSNEGRQFLLPLTFVSVKSVEECLGIAEAETEDELLLQGERMTDFIRELREMTINTFLDVELATSMLAYAFGMGDKVDTRARVNMTHVNVKKYKEAAVDIIEEMDNALRNATVVEPEDMHTITTNSISVIGAVMESSKSTVMEGRILPSDMEHVYEIEYSTNIDDPDFEMEDDPDKILETGIILAEQAAAPDQEMIMSGFAETIAEKVLTNMVIGEPSMSTSLRSAAAVFTRFVANDTSNSSFHQHNSSFTLPDVCVLRNLTGDECERAPPVAMAAFTWDAISHPFGKNLDDVSPDSKSVEINVYDTELESMDGLKIKNLSEDIDIHIPRIISNTSMLEPNLITPSFKWYEFMMYHQIPVEQPDSSISIEITPVKKEANLLVYIRHNKKPVFEEFDYFFNLKMLKSSEDSATKQIYISSNEVGKKIGNYYIGVTELKDDISDSITNGSEVNGNSTIRNFTDYQILFYTSSCLYFNEKLKKWTTGGCWVVSASYSSTHCKCNHLTTFAGGFMVAPNSIDFAYVFANASFADNLTIYCCIIVTFVLFIIFLIWARWKDIKDKEKLGALPVADNNSNDKYLYELLIFTGNERCSSTKSKISFVLSGDKEETDIRAFGTPAKRCFKKDGIDVFVLAVPRPLGQLQFLHIWHDNSGPGIYASWNLKFIMIRDVQTGEKFEFIVNDWFSLEKGDGLIDRVIPVAGREQLTEFGHLFNQTSHKNLSDGHLWFSVFLRPPRSRFTRCQRVCTCIAVLYLSMLVNAMWYGTVPETPTGNAMKMGPLNIGLEQISIGVFSNLIIFPPTFLIIVLFRKSRPRKLRKSRIDEAIEKQRIKTQNESLNNKDSEVQRRGKKQKEQERWRGDDDLSPLYIRKKRFTLPWWFSIIAWILCFACIGVSIFFLWAYGIQFGNEKTKKWLSSLIISFVTSIFITQPIKVFCLAMVFASICKKIETDEDDADEDEMDPALAYDEEWLHTRDPTEPRRIAYKPPDPTLVEEARKARLQEVQMWKVLREIAIYLIFLWILTVIGYGARDPNAFYVREILESQLKVNFSDKKAISSTEDFWVWAKETLTPALMADRLYNGNAPIGYRGFLKDMASRMLGHAIMRQIRIKNYVCKPTRFMQDAIRNCSGTYTNIFYESDESYGPLVNKSLQIEELNGRRLYENRIEDYNTAFQYGKDERLTGMMTVGQLSTYTGRGFIVKLVGNKDERNERILYLKETNWIDVYTRAILVEFSVFNGQVDIFGVVKLLVEFFPGGGVIPDIHVTTMRYASYKDGLGYFLLTCQLIYVIYVFYLTIQAFMKMCKLKKEYWRQLWNYVDLAMISFSYAAIVCYVIRTVELKRIATYLRETSYNYYTNLQYPQVLDSYYGIFISFVIFMAIIKCIKMLQFNMRISMLSSSLLQSAIDLRGFFFAFSVSFMAFASLFYLYFSGHIMEFLTIPKTLGTMVSITLNKFNFEQYMHADPYFAPLIFFTFTMSTNIVLINIFMSIIIGTFEEVKEAVGRQKNQFEIIDFMTSRVKQALGFKKPIQSRPVIQTIDEEIDKTKEFTEKMDRLLSYVNKHYLDGKLDLKDKNALKLYRKKKINYIPIDSSVIKEKSNIFQA